MAPFALYMMVVFFEYYGFARFVPLVNTLSLSLLTSLGLLGYVLSRRQILVWLKEKQVILLLVLLFLTMLSILHAFVRSYSVNVLRGQIGYFILFVVSLYFVADARKARILVWQLVLIHVGLVVENKDKLFAAREGYYVGGYFLGDGNDFGWSLNVVFPLAVYLFLTSRAFVVRALSLFACLMLVIGIAGTSSRGAALALGAGLLCYLIMSDRKLLGLAMISVVMVGVLLLAPSAYFDRLQTIGEYSEDTSAAGRIEAWGAAINMAIDHPLGVGAGNFNSAYGRFYRSDDFFSARWISPHSIYFLTLGEYGFLGLLVLLAILFLNFNQNRRSQAYLRGIEEPPISPLWPMCINMSLVAYAVGGAFLGGVNYPHIYMLTALTIGAKVMAGSGGGIGDKPE